MAPMQTPPIFSSGYATQIVNSYSQSIVLQTLRSGRSPVVGVFPEPRVWFNPDLKSSYFMVPGVVALVLMIITMTLTSLGIVKEKELGTLEQLMVTPIRPFEVILGKLLPFTVIGFVDVIIVLAVARYWFQVPLVGNLLLLFALSGSLHPYHSRAGSFSSPRYPDRSSRQ